MKAFDPMTMFDDPPPDDDTHPRVMRITDAGDGVTPNEYEEASRHETREEAVAEAERLNREAGNTIDPYEGLLLPSRGATRYYVVR